MRASTLKSTLKALFPVQRTVCIEGAPGGGKTTIIAEVARELGVHYIERHMPTMPLEDFGIPDVMNTESTVFGYKMPDWFPSKGSAYDDGRGGILAFDDRNQCGDDLQKVMANICQARNLHGVPLADGWMVASTGNRQSDKAGTNRVLSHLRNRETVLDLDSNLEDWMKWAIDHGVNATVISFLNYRPNLLHDFDPQRGSNPTPRSWVEGVSDILEIVPAEAEYDCIKGAVGDGAAAEFVGFRRIVAKLPDPDSIIKDPMHADVPTDPATLYALAGALADRANADNFANVVAYFNRVPPEFSVLGVSYAARKDISLSSTQAFTDWAIAHDSVLF